MPLFSWKIISIFSSLGTSALVPFALSTSTPLFNKETLETQKGDIPEAHSPSSTSEVTIKEGRGGQTPINSEGLEDKLDTAKKLTKEKPDVKKPIDPNSMMYWGIEGTDITGIISAGVHTTNLACCNTKLSGPFHRFLINSQLTNYEIKYPNGGSQLLFMQFPKNFKNVAELLSKYSSSWIQTTWSSTFGEWPIKWAAQKIKSGEPSISYQTLRENNESPSLGSRYITKQEIVDQIEFPEENDNVFLVEVAKHRLSPILDA